jgi:hypothetical protein
MNKALKYIIFGLILFSLIGFTIAIDFIPQGNLNMKNIWNITNVPYVNGINISALNSSKLDKTDQRFNDTNYINTNFYNKSSDLNGLNNYAIKNFTEYSTPNVKLNDSGLFDSNGTLMSIRSPMKVICKSSSLSQDNRRDCDIVCKSVDTELTCANLLNGLISNLSNSGGGSIIIKGVYLVNNTITWKDKISILGESRDSSILKMSCGFPTNQNPYWFLMMTGVTEGDAGYLNITLKDITLDGNKNCNPLMLSDTSDLIHSFADKSFIVDNVRFTNMNGTGLDCDNTPCIITNSEADNNRADGFYLNYFKDGSISNSISHNNGRDGIHSPQVGGKIISNGIWSNGRDGIHLAGTNAETTWGDRKIIIGNTIYSNSDYSIYLEGQGDYGVRNSIISNNIIYSSANTYSIYELGIIRNVTYTNNILDKPIFTSSDSDSQRLFNVGEPNVITNPLSFNNNIFINNQTKISSIGLKVYYPPIINSTDYSGNGNDGIPININYGSDSKFSNYFIMNGSTSYIQIPASANLPGSSNRTICIWINNAQNITNNWIYSEGTQNAGQLFAFFRESSGGKRIDYTFWGTDFIGSNSIIDNNWYHVCATYDGIQVRSYVNGLSDGNLTISLNTVEGQEQLGNTALRGSGSFNGSMYGFMKFNRTLYQQEIISIYNIGNDYMSPNAYILKNSNISWTKLQDFPVSCPVGTHLLTLGISTTCTSDSIDNTNISVVNINKSGFQYPNIRGVSSQSLLAYYPFDNDKLDYSGNGNHLNGNSISVINGKFGNSDQFTSTTNDNITLSKGFPLFNIINNNFSISLWINGTSNQDYNIFYGEGSSSSVSPLYELSAKNSKLDFFIRNDASGTIKAHTLSSNTVFDNSWHHIVFTDSNGTVYLYVDGKLDSTDFSYSKSGVGSFNLANRSCIGSRCSTTSSSNFIGNIDEFRVYNRTLTIEEVKSLYELNMQLTSKDAYQLKGQDVNPITNLFYNLGSSINRWLKLWVNDIDVTGTINLTGSAKMQYNNGIYSIFENSTGKFCSNGTTTISQEDNPIGQVDVCRGNDALTDYCYSKSCDVVCKSTSSDCSSILQNSVNSNKNIFWKGGNYPITRLTTGSMISFSDLQNFSIKADGVVLSAIYGNTQEKIFAVSFVNVKDAYLTGLSILGNSLCKTPEDNCKGVYVDNSSFVEFNKLNVKGIWGYPIFLDSTGNTNNIFVHHSSFIGVGKADVIGGGINSNGKIMYNINVYNNFVNQSMSLGNYAGGISLTGLNDSRIYSNNVYGGGIEFTSEKISSKNKVYDNVMYPFNNTLMITLGSDNQLNNQNDFFHNTIYGVIRLNGYGEIADNNYVYDGSNGTSTTELIESQIGSGYNTISNNYCFGGWRCVGVVNNYTLVINNHAIGLNGSSAIGFNCDTGSNFCSLINNDLQINAGNTIQNGFYLTSKNSTVIANKIYNNGIITGNVIIVNTANGNNIIQNNLFYGNDASSGNLNVASGNYLSQNIYTTSNVLFNGVNSTGVSYFFGSNPSIIIKSSIPSILFNSTAGHAWKIASNYDSANTLTFADIDTGATALSINESRINIASGSKVCFDGVGCNHYLKWNGTCVANSTTCIV